MGKVQPITATPAVQNKHTHKREFTNKQQSKTAPVVQPAYVLDLSPEAEKMLQDIL